MMLEMRMLHEGDLFRMFEELDKKAKGLFEIKVCNLQRESDMALMHTSEVTDKNIRAMCELIWYTFKVKA